MYIPVSYFGGGEGCITATGGVTGSYVSGGVLWKYHKFDADNFESSSFNVISGSTLRGKLLVIGGGGSGGATGGSTTVAAGGGGAGGVVYYEQFPIISGSYNLVVAKGVPGAYGFRRGDDAIANNGNDGRYSSVQTPFGPYTPFTSSVIIAFGGGGGGVAGYGVTASYGVQPGFGGASGGGNAQNDNGYAIASSSNFAGDGFGGINLNDQGNFGGSIPADTVSFNTSFMITGGGGAGASSLSVLDTGGAGGSPQYTDGGDGLQFDIDGTSSYYAGGGGSYSSQKSGNDGYTNDGLGANTWGGGGRAERGGIGQFSESGSGGLIVFAYRLCPFSNDCTTYTGYAGASTATINFIDCYTNLPMSKSVNAGQSSSVCSRTFAQYPYITGTGASLQSGSSCNSKTIFYKSYQLAQCSTTSSFNVSISETASLSIGSVIKLTDYTSSCYFVSGTLTYSPSYPITYISNSYVNCDACNNDPFTGSYTIDYLIVGGGGGGGAIGTNGEAGGGGGGGQYLTGSLTISASNIFNITIGAGGAINTNGNSSSFISTAGPSISLTSFGGGYGGYGTSSILNNGASGANGGGGGVDFDIIGTGGIGFSGSNGANANYSSPFPPQRQSGGGGGGNSQTPPTGSNGLIGPPGGSGSLWFNGNYYSAGGAGGYYHTGTGGQNVTAGLGGSSIGGNGAYKTANIGNPGADATYPTQYRGAGGGGAASGYSASGGSSGSIVLRYSSSFQIGSGGILYNSGGYFYHYFESNGTYDASYNS